MKKVMKIILILVIGFILCLIIDVWSILTFSKPIFAIKEDNGDSVNIVYRGVFYDTYNCMEYSMAMIKAKGSKYACSTGAINKSEVAEIVDRTKEYDAFACGQALQKFYEDDKYIYSWSCIKDSYIVVKYLDGNEETVSSALKKGTIKISDLDEYNIKYYKELK